MIVNHWADLRDYLDRLPGREPDPQWSHTTGQEIYHAGIKAGLAPSQDWSHYLKKWEDAKWENPEEKDSPDGRPTLAEWKASQAVLHAQQLELDRLKNQPKAPGE